MTGTSSGARSFCLVTSAWWGFRVLGDCVKSQVFGGLLVCYIKEHLCRRVLIIDLIFACVVLACLESGSLLPCEQAPCLGLDSGM